MTDWITSNDAERIFNRFLINIRRSRRLASLAFEANPVVQEAADDLLRSASVLLHASIEDLLRSIGRLRLPTADGDVLAAIPLIDVGGGLGEDRRFTLRHLARHRGAMVDDLIYQSVRAHLDRRSFSSTDDVQEFLQRLGIDLVGVRPYFADLAQLTARRHQIVHRADFLDDNRSAPEGWTANEVSDLGRWIRSLMLLGREVVRLSLPQSARNDWLSSVDSFVRELA